MGEERTCVRRVKVSENMKHSFEVSIKQVRFVRLRRKPFKERPSVRTFEHGSL